MCANTKWCGPKCGAAMHLLSGLAWLLGVVSLVLAWVATANGLAWGQDAEHWFSDVTALALLGILGALAAGYHRGGSCGSHSEGEGKCGCSDGKC